MRILDYYDIDLKGKNVVVVGRSNIVGRPISILTSLKMNGANGTTTICHSGTPDIAHHTRLADIVIVALGVPGFLDKDMLKEGAIVIDVGISKKNNKSYGDVDPLNTDEILYARSPFPGGVGPITVSALYSNLAKLIS